MTPLSLYRNSWRLLRAYHTSQGSRKELGIYYRRLNFTIQKLDDGSHVVDEVYYPTKYRLYESEAGCHMESIDGSSKLSREELETIRLFRKVIQSKD